MNKSVVVMFDIINNMNFGIYKTPGIAKDKIAKGLTYMTIQSSFSSIMQLLGLIVLFFVILVLAVFLTKWIGSVSMGIKNNQNISVVETYKISQNKYIQIVKITNKYIAMAVSKDSVEMLAELNEEDIDFESKGTSLDLKYLKRYIDTKITSKNSESSNNELSKKKKTDNGEKNFSKLLDKFKNQ